MAEGPLSIKLRCASWQQLATIYRRDLSHGTMFLRAATPPPVGTAVHIDLTLPSATVLALTGAITAHVQDPQRGAGIEIKLDPIAESSIWLIESALASEQRRIAATPALGVPTTTSVVAPSPHQLNSSIPTISGSSAVSALHGVPGISDAEDLSAAERDLIKALMSEAESLKKLNPFLVLGVGYEATDAEVRAAFGELTKRYHPDRFARYESSELREVAAEIFILIRDAYRRLGDAPARATVLQSLGKAASPPRAIPAPSRPPATVPAPPIARQRSVVQSVQPASGHAPTAPITPITGPLGPGAPLASPATTILPPHQTPRAPTMPGPGNTGGMRRPTTAQPIQPPAEAVDVSALEELIDQNRLDEALAGYRSLGKRYPSDRNVRAGAELVEGLMALNVRDRLEAAQRFEAALEIDPSNERAARELADMRRQATNERKGLLSRLMGKKEP